MDYTVCPGGVDAPVGGPSRSLMRAAWYAYSRRDYGSDQGHDRLSLTEERGKATTSSCIMQTESDLDSHHWKCNMHTSKPASRVQIGILDGSGTSQLASAIRPGSLPRRCGLTEQIGNICHTNTESHTNKKSHLPSAMQGFLGLRLTMVDSATRNALNKSSPPRGKLAPAGVTARSAEHAV